MLNIVFGLVREGYYHAWLNLFSEITIFFLATPFPFATDL